MKLVFSFEYLAASRDIARWERRQERNERKKSGKRKKNEKRE